MARTFRQQRHLRGSKDRESNERNERRWWFLAVCGVPAWGLRRVRESHVRLSGPKNNILIAFIFLYSFYFSYLCFLINPIMCDRKPQTEQIVPSHRPENSWFMCQVSNHHPEEVYLPTFVPGTYRRCQSTSLVPFPRPCHMGNLVTLGVSFCSPLFVWCMYQCCRVDFHQIGPICEPGYVFLILITFYSINHKLGPFLIALLQSFQSMRLMNNNNCFLLPVILYCK